jgi:hypothetical protein
MPPAATLCLPARVLPSFKAVDRLPGSLAKLVVFLLLSSLDLFLTWQLLHRDYGFYESNPLANWWLTHWGWYGLSLFKLSAVAVVGGVWSIVAPLKPRLGELILSFACGVLFLVVLYSSALAGYVGPEQAESSVRQAQRVESAARSLEERMQATQDFRAMQQELSRSIVAGERLTDAVARLEKARKCQNQEWLAMLGHGDPKWPDRACLAVNLARFTASARDSSPTLVARLERELREDFGVGDVSIKADRGSGTQTPIVSIDAIPRYPRCSK